MFIWRHGIVCEMHVSAGEQAKLVSARAMAPGLVATDPAAREAADRQQCMYEITWQADTPNPLPSRPMSAGREISRMVAARMVFLDPEGRMLKELKTRLRRPVRSVAQATARLCDQQATALQRKLPEAQPGTTVCLITRGNDADATAAPAGLTGRGVALLAASTSLAAMHRVAAAENPALRWVKLGVAAGSASAGVQTRAQSAPDPALLARAAGSGGQGLALAANVWTAPKLVARPHSEPGLVAPATGSPQQLGTVLVTGDRVSPPSSPGHQCDTSPGLHFGNRHLMCCVMPAAGGTGSVGSLVALWLAEHAASHVILLGRSGRHPPESRLAAYTCVQTISSLLVHEQQIRHPAWLPCSFASQGACKDSASATLICCVAGLRTRCTWLAGDQRW